QAQQPQQELAKQKDDVPANAAAKMLPEQCEFSSLIGDQMDGTLARFLQNQLKVLFWHRSPQDLGVVFGAQVNLPGLIQRLLPVVKLDPTLTNEVAVALLDDTAHPKVLSHPAFTGDWRHSFVSAEIGEAL